MPAVATQRATFTLVGGAGVASAAGAGPVLAAPTEKVRDPPTSWPSSEITFQATHDRALSRVGRWGDDEAVVLRLASTAQSSPVGVKACTPSVLEADRLVEGEDDLVRQPAATTAPSAGSVDSRLACAAAGDPVRRTRTPATAEHSARASARLTPGARPRVRARAAAAEDQAEQPGDQAGDREAVAVVVRVRRRGRRLRLVAASRRAPWASVAGRRGHLERRRRVLEVVLGLPGGRHLRPRRLALLAGLDRREDQGLPGGVLRDLQGELEGVALAVRQRGLGGVDDLAASAG